MKQDIRMAKNQRRDAEKDELNKKYTKNQNR